MAKFVRFKTGNIPPSYGLVEGSDVTLLEGDVFLGYRLLKTVLQLRDLEILAPVLPPNIYAVGLNYRDHAEENNLPYPKIPPVFMKANTSVIAHGEKIKLPKCAPKMVDYEAELGVIIKKPALNVPEDKAMEFVAGYTCADDVSARDVQFETNEKQWVRGKSFNTFCPLGPFIVTDVYSKGLSVELRLNGKVMQKSNTDNLIHNVSKLIAHLSQDNLLLPQTLILTGTPGGVGHFKKPPVYLKPGDDVEVEIGDVGILRNIVE
ncbi:MAG: fumarylacetoacetate hydrolase family protein [Elusimicrobiota bacterium]